MSNRKPVIAVLRKRHLAAAKLALKRYTNKASCCFCPMALLAKEALNKPRAIAAGGGVFSSESGNCIYQYGNKGARVERLFDQEKHEEIKKMLPLVITFNPV